MFAVLRTTYANCPIDTGTTPTLQLDPTNSVFAASGPTFTYYMYTDPKKIIWSDAIVATTLAPTDDCGRYKYTLTKSGTNQPIDPETFWTDFESGGSKILRIRSTDIFWWVGYWTNPY